MNDERNFDKKNSNGLNANMLAMLALANNTGFAAGNIGFNTVVPPFIIAKGEKDNEKDLTR